MKETAVLSKGHSQSLYGECRVPHVSLLELGKTPTHRADRSGFPVSWASTLIDPLADLHGRFLAAVPTS